MWSACSHHPPPVSVEQLKGRHQIVVYIPAGGVRSAVTLLSKSLTACACSCGTLGRPRRPKSFSYRQEMGDRERLLYPGGPSRVLLDFTRILTTCINPGSHLLSPVHSSLCRIGTSACPALFWALGASSCTTSITTLCHAGHDPFSISQPFLLSAVWSKLL